MIDRHRKAETQSGSESPADAAGTPKDDDNSNDNDDGEDHGNGDDNENGEDHGKDKDSTCNVSRNRASMIIMMMTTTIITGMTISTITMTITDRIKGNEGRDLRRAQRMKA